MLVCIELIIKSNFKDTNNYVSKKETIVLLLPYMSKNLNKNNDVEITKNKVRNKEKSSSLFRVAMSNTSLS